MPVLRSARDVDLVIAHTTNVSKSSALLLVDALGKAKLLEMKKSTVSTRFHALGNKAYFHAPPVHVFAKTC